MPGLIDEIPALAALAAMMPRGRTLTVRGAGELRVKESDRISALAAGFRAMGAVVDETEDGFTLESGHSTGPSVDAEGDHRLAMAFAIAATRASAPVTILGASCGGRVVPGILRDASPVDAVRTDKIYLVGFMAAGKTTVARALAARLQWRAEDVDELIEARERRPVADIFARRGEAYFRSAEREIVRLLLPLRHTVVATGGGTFVDPENQAAINLDGVSVWLDVPFDELLARIPNDGRRPLAADRDQMERLFALRTIAYAAAHVRVDAAGRPAEELADRIVERIRTE